jgi:PAS domain S-box-containing protein
VLFTDRPAPAPAGTVPADAARADVEQALRLELASTREYLQSVIQQLEVGNEELKAANEEILSSNEELQSTNEELQTAKEELQATNEELRTVNDEMLDRNVEATRLSDDLANVLSSVAIPIVILGRDSTIRRFTPTATKILNLIPGDVGRPITDIQTKIRIPDLSALVADVLQHLVPLDKTIQAEDGRWYQLGVRPYRTLDNRIDGTVLTVYDIDALKKAELSLAEARHFAESIVETMRECLVVVDGDLRVRQANRAFCEQFRTTVAEIEGRRLDALDAKASGPLGLTHLIEGLPSGGQLENVRLERELPGVGWRTLMVNGRRLERSGWFLLTLVDITERARAEERLAKSEAGFRQMLTSAAEPILISDPRSRIVFANEVAKRVFGYPGEEMVGLHVNDLLPERFREAHATLHANYMAAPTPRPMGLDRDLVGLRKTGEEFPVAVALSPMEGSEGPLVVAFVSDISARKEAERKIVDYQTKLQRMVFQSALVEERERRRIAQDLHDHIGQSLALARIKLEAARSAAVGVAEAIDAAVALIATSIEETRTLTFELAPPILYDLGLKAALSWLCEETEKRTGVHVEIADGGPDEPLDQTTSALVFRAVRELLTNVFKHAQTPAARIALKEVGDHFEIAVEDKGTGFDVEKAAHGSSGGFGLFSVREQIARLGGTVDIQSTPRDGTRVTLRVPTAMEDGAEGAPTKENDENPAGG